MTWRILGWLLLVVLCCSLGMPGSEAWAQRRQQPRHTQQQAPRTRTKRPAPARHRPKTTRKVTRKKTHAPVRTATPRRKTTVRRAPVARRTTHTTKRTTKRTTKHAPKKALKKYTHVMEVTAYCPSSGGNGGRTALGKRAKRGVIAVDPKVIPLGTLLYVEGYGYGRAGDVGRHLRGHRIDICYNTRREALHWGRRKVKVTVIRAH